MGAAKSPGLPRHLTSSAAAAKPTSYYLATSAGCGANEAISSSVVMNSVPSSKRPLRR
jgi:hypothetical protein